MLSKQKLNLRLSYMLSELHDVCCPSAALLHNSNHVLFSENADQLARAHDQTTGSSLSSGDLVLSLKLMRYANCIVTFTCELPLGNGQSSRKILASRKTTENREGGTW